MQSLTLTYTWALIIVARLWHLSTACWIYNFVQSLTVGQLKVERFYHKNLSDQMKITYQISNQPQGLLLSKLIYLRQGHRLLITSIDHFIKAIISVWISNYIHYNMQDEITYPFSNFNGTTAKFWEWISNFTPHYTGHVIIHPCWDFR